MVGKGALTPHGLNFIQKSLDPFHDTELGAVDFPDGLSQRVVIKEVNQSVTITNPGAVWDCHIAAMPDLARTITNSTGNVATTSFQFATASPGQLVATAAPVCGGGVAYCVVPSGDATYVSTGPNISSVSPAVQITGLSRVIGMAFEVHNVTEELYKSGSVTVYRTATGAELDRIQFPAQLIDEIAGSPATYIVGRSAETTWRKSQPPNSEAEALLIPGSMQWEAADGCYVVGALEGEPKYHSWDTHSRLYTSAYDFVRATPTNPTSAMVGHSVLSSTLDTGGDITTTYPSSVQQFFTLGVRQSGAYFTGLSTQTKLRLNVKYLIACQPDSDDPLITLAKPAGPKDNLAIEIYSRCIEKIPPGVKVSENGAGDWFRGLLGVVSKVAPIVGSAFGPAGAVIGKGVGMAAGLGNAALGGSQASNSSSGLPAPSASGQLRSVSRATAGARVPRPIRKRAERGKLVAKMRALKT